MTRVEHPTAQSLQSTPVALRAISLVNDLEMKAAQALMLGIIVLVFAAAALRWLNHPIVWSVDLAQLLFLWVSFLGADQALLRHKHVGVDVLTRRFPPRVQRFVRVVTYVLILAFFVVVLVYGTELCIESRYRRFAGMDVSFLWATMSAPIGSLLLIKTLLVLIAGEFGLLALSQGQVVAPSAEQAPPPL